MLFKICWEIRFHIKCSYYLIKGHKETLGSAEYVSSFDCGDGITGVCVCSNSSNCTHEVIAVLCTLYLDKAVKK